MSVTIYLTDHNGRKIAFFYRIDNERYSTAPQLIWCCRNYPEYQGRAESKECFIEQAKHVMRELKKQSVPDRKTKTCDVCDKSLQGMENEGTKCIEHDFEE
jgi:hypothetical protein